MDVAYYISELLGQLGEVNVPGLGYFARLRVDGYYDEKAATLHPPQYKVAFDRQSIDDEVLYQYIAEKKNISLASSKYFTEKYITTLKEQANGNEVPFADLGAISIANGVIVFKAASTSANDPAFFGYPQIKLNKLSDAPVEEPTVTKVPEPVYIPQQAPTAEPVKQPEPVREMFTPEEYKPQSYIPQPTVYSQNPETYKPAEDEHDELVDVDIPHVEYKRPKRLTYIRVIIALAVVAALLVLVIFGLYKYDPVLFNEFTTTKTAPAVIKHDTIKTDTTVKQTIDTSKTPATAKRDTTTAQTQPAATVTPPAVNDTLTKIHYEILGGAFGSLDEANIAIGNYKKLGIEARILNNVPGKLYKVTLGTFFDYQQAVNAEDTLLKTKKISKNSISLQPYHPKKTNQ
jgi:cell division septation protein DedD